MVNERLNKAQQRLNAYYDAELAVLTGQEYRIGTRTVRRADLAEIRDTIGILERQVAQLQAIESGQGPRRAIRITPRDL